MAKRGRPHGAISRGTYFKLLRETNSPKAYKRALRDFVGQLRRGRPHAKTESLQIISGRIRVKVSPTRTINVAGKSIKV